MSNYNPIPPRVWSRVENPCVFLVPGSTYQQAYIPLTGQVVSQAQANYQEKLIYKGNILQYKGNSARFTKSQKYSQLAKMAGPNRTKVFATQSQTYSNPNTTGLLRLGYSTYPFPNQIPGAPNNISGPFAYGITNPNDCSGNSIQDGGTLVCGTFANPCSGEIIKRGINPVNICYPASASNVPGTSVLCWNNKVQTWFPRQRYVMNNSGTNWPEGYKEFVSALKPPTPVLTLVSSTDNYVTLSWSVTNNDCIPISSYNIYVNGQIYTNVPYTTTTITINDLGCENSFNVTSISNTIESNPSNNVITNNIPFSITGGGSFINNSGTYTFTFTSNGTITFYCMVGQLDIILVGGGGGGAPGSTNLTDDKGGGGGGGGEVYSFSTSAYTLGIQNNIVIGSGGSGGTPGLGNQSSGTETKITLNSNYIASFGFEASGLPGGNGGGLYGGSHGNPGQDGTISNGYYGGGGGGNGYDGPGTGVGNKANGGGGGGVAYDFISKSYLSGTGGKGGINGTDTTSGTGGSYNGGNGGIKGFSGINGTYGGGGGGGGGIDETTFITGHGGDGGGGFCIISFNYS